MGGHIVIRSMAPPFQTTDVPDCVGVLVWRAVPGLRELAALEVGERTILPKGVIEPGEEPQAAAERVALAFSSGRTDEAQHLGTVVPASASNGSGSGDPERDSVDWWKLRWTGADGHPPESHGVRLVWLTFEEAALRLSHRSERELVSARAPFWQRALEFALRGRAARARSQRAELDDLRRRMAARPDAPTGEGGASWRTLAFERIERASQARADGDERGACTALAEARRLELFGLTQGELEVFALELEQAQESLTEEHRELAERLLGDGPLEATRLERVVALVDTEQEARARVSDSARDERRTLAVVTGVLLVLVLLAGDASWFSTGTEVAPGLRLAVILFGGLGGATSALFAPRAVRGLPAILLRPLVGAVAGLALHTLLRSGLLAPGAPTPPASLCIAYAAGFLERLMPRGT